MISFCLSNPSFFVMVCWQSTADCRIDNAKPRKSELSMEKQNMKSTVKERAKANSLEEPDSWPGSGLQVSHGLLAPPHPMVQSDSHAGTPVLPPRDLVPEILHPNVLTGHKTAAWKQSFGVDRIQSRGRAKQEQEQEQEIDICKDSPPRHSVKTPTHSQVSSCASHQAGYSRCADKARHARNAEAGGRARIQKTATAMSR